MDTLYILDSYGLIYRSYYAFISKPLLNSEGHNISAIFGFFRNFHRFLKDYSPKYIVAAFDSKTPTFRHQMYAEYKATRQKTPDDLHAQIPIIEEILLALGIPVLRTDGFEADDIIATLATKWKENDGTVKILTGDKDLLQLVDDKASVLRPDKVGGWEAVDEQKVFELWSVTPSQILDMLSLLGDSADNIPGVKGVGEKTASKLLAEYKSLDNIYANISKISGATQKKLIDGKEDAYFSQKLVKLCYDVPINFNANDYDTNNLHFENCAKLLKNVGAFAVAKSFFASAGVEDLDTQNALQSAPQVDVTLGAQNSTFANAAQTAQTQKNLHGQGDLFAQDLFSSTDGANGANNAPTQNGADNVNGTDAQALQMPKIEFTPKELLQNNGVYTSVTNLEQLSSIISVALEQGFVSFDLETNTVNTLCAKIAGFSLATECGKAFYVPLITAESNLLGGLEYINLQDALKELARIFLCKDMTIITHNGKFDYEVLRANGLAKPVCRFVDTMIASWLLNPDYRSFALETLVAEHLSLQTTPFDALVPKQQRTKGMTFLDVPLDKAVQYGAEDADITLQLWRFLEPKLKDAKLEELFYTVEMPLLPILAEMELAGIGIDKNALKKLEEELKQKLIQTEEQIYELAGKNFNIASTKQLQEVLFVDLALPPSKKTKTGYSTDTAVLEELAKVHPVPKKILEYRSFAKLLSTYVEALPQLADKNGRIHTTFMQTGTATGRLSSRDPNLQNIPIKDDEGRKIRSAFVPQAGYKLVSADYSQIELVLLAHISCDKALQEAFCSGVDVHKATAKTIFNVDDDGVTTEMRRTAKVINFGVLYGMSAFRLANELDITRTQAKTFIDAYFTRYASVQQCMQNLISNAEQTGFVETILKRRRYIYGINSKNKTEKSASERVAINTPIQGSAADIVKKAMIAVNDAFTKQNLNARLLLQVHDELIAECPTEEVETVKNILQTEMENIIKLNVPLRVSVEAGDNWGLFH